MPAPPPTKLDPQQVLQHSFDDDTGSLRTTVTATITPTGTITVAIDGSSDNIALSDGSSTATFTTVGPKTGLDTYVINPLAVSSIVPVGITGTVAISGASLTASIAGTSNVNVVNSLAISSIVPVAISGTTAVSGSVSSTILNSLAISSIVPVSITGTSAVSGSISATLLNSVAISSIVPVAISGTSAVSGSVSSTIVNPLAISSIVPVAISGTTAVSGSVSSYILDQLAISSIVPIAISGTSAVSGSVSATVLNPLTISSIVPVSITGTSAISGSVSATVLNSLAISSIVPVAISGTSAVSGSVSATVVNSLAITSIVPVAVSGTTAISGSALTATIAGTANTNVTNSLAISSIVPIAITSPTNYGTAVSAIRVAAQIGNATAVADFGAGTTTTQTIRVVLPTDQSDVPVRVKDSVGNNLDSITGGDAVTATLRGLIGQTENYVFNGTTWDRARSAGIGSNAASTGIQANAVYGQYNTAATAMSTGNFSPIQLDEKAITMVKPDFAGYTLQSKVFSCNTALVNIATTTETPMVLIKNPSGSTIIVRLFKITLGSDDSTVAHRMTYNIYAMPTITANGTAVTTINNRVKAAPTAGTAQIFKSPTISANGTLMASFIKFGQTSEHIYPIDNQIVIEANSHVLITCTTSVNNIATSTSLWWAEV